MKCDKCGYSDNGTGDSAHTCFVHALKQEEHKMNELIEKIYGEACLAAGNLNEREFCEKFAQLIVQACGSFTDPVTRNLMMKHFGVEE